MQELMQDIINLVDYDYQEYIVDVFNNIETEEEMNSFETFLRKVYAQLTKV